MLGLGKHNIEITLLIYILTTATKLASELVYVFLSLGTCLISNDLRVDISFFLFSKYFFIFSSLASKALFT